MGFSEDINSLPLTKVNVFTVYIYLDLCLKIYIELDNFFWDSQTFLSSLASKEFVLWFCVGNTILLVFPEGEVLLIYQKHLR